MQRYVFINNYLFIFVAAKSIKVFMFKALKFIVLNFCSEL